MLIKSLSARIVCAVAAILALAGLLIGAALYRSVKHSVSEELESRLYQRIAWLSASAELDDEGKLEFEPRHPGSVLPQHWQIWTRDGKVLWQSQWEETPAPFQTKFKSIVLGNANGAPLSANDISPASQGEGKAQYSAYSVAKKNGRLEVLVGAREPAEAGNAELNRLLIAMWTIGPVSILILVLVLGAFVKWLLAPLSSMSQQAAEIGPRNVALRIGSVGSSVELVRLREALNAMVQRLAEGMERERQFSAMAAHELRTPLTQLRANIEITLSRERGTPEYKESLQTALQDVERLQRLISNLLFLTREHGDQQMRNDVPLEPVITRAVKDCASSARIESDLRSLTVRGNEELLESAIRNVLDNAARYAPGAATEIRASRTGNDILLTVSDSGPGVPEADRERIFEPLTRLDQARTIDSEQHGFGLGLTVARCAVRACGGELLCRARADGESGAEFVFKLPGVTV